MINGHLPQKILVEPLIVQLAFLKLVTRKQNTTTTNYKISLLLLLSHPDMCPEEFLTQQQ